MERCAIAAQYSVVNDRGDDITKNTAKPVGDVIYGDL
jgi:hypothetical protein